MTDHNKAVEALVEALKASTRYLEGTNPFHISNGVRNMDQRAKNADALAAWENRNGGATGGGTGC